MSEEVRDDNPYSRLMALKKMGVVPNYSEIREHTVLVIGLGGIGSVAAEMLTRCGVGKLILFDYDTVELANMNRLFFRPEQAGLTKVEAAKATLQSINPEVSIDCFCYDVTSVDNYDHFITILRSNVSLVLSCVDNYSARITINRACAEVEQVWLESGVSEDAMSGHIQAIYPGETACFECAPPYVVASGGNEKEIQREGVCAASLPTTMGVIAGILVQNSLKYLLRFGKVAAYVGYSSLEDFFPSYSMAPNPDCSNPRCKSLQAYYLENPHKKRFMYSEEVKSEDVLHQENDWGISVVNTGEEKQTPTQKPKTQNLSLEEMRNQLSQIQSKSKS